MKKLGIALLCLCCLLCACQSGVSEAENLQQQYGQVRRAEMEAEITCHLEQENRSFTVQCVYDKDTGGVTTITAPKEVAGISATVSGEDLSVEWNGLSLAMGEAVEISPANCLPWLLRAAATGYIVDCGQETVEQTDCLRVGLDTSGRDGKVLCTAWFDRETLTPCYMEFSRDDRVILSAKMLSFTWEGA